MAFGLAERVSAAADNGSDQCWMVHQMSGARVWRIAAPEALGPGLPGKV